jgi:glycosyltransferase involved in cell wall biosynthesis
MPYEFLYKAREFPQKNQFSIVHVANQVNYKSRKGHNELIKALSIVRNNGVNAKITFVGEDYNNGIAKLLDLASFYGIRDHVTFTGFVSRDKLRQILIESDIAVLPTKVEGLPRVIIEAMALGLPCITTPVSGNPELIDTEFLVNYSDVECIARKIEELLKNKQLYEYESNVNYERSKEYTADILNARRTKFYNELKSMVLANKKKK